MSPKPNISAVLSDANKLAIKTNIDNSRTLISFGVNLNPEERQRLRKTGSKREGYVVDVYTGCVGNPTSLPGDFSLTEWTKDEVLNKQLIEVREWVASFLEMLEDTILLLGSERIRQADVAYTYLKQSAKTNTSLTELVARIGRQFEGQGRKKADVTFNVGVKGSVEVSRVVPGTKIVNTGNAVICMKAGSELAKIVKREAININPNSSVTIPAGYTSIIVENLSATDEGSFTVHTR